MRAVDKSARVPGERLGPVVVGVELVDGETVVASGCKSQHQDCAQQGGRGDELGIDPRPLFPPPLGRTGERRQPSYLFRSPAGRRRRGELLEQGLRPAEYCGREGVMITSSKAPQVGQTREEHMPNPTRRNLLAG